MRPGTGERAGAAPGGGWPGHSEPAYPPPGIPVPGLDRADGPGRPLLGELLLAAVLTAADEAGLTQLTGKVHAGNLGMRALYRKFGFTATHLTMERRPPEPPK